MGKGPVGRWGVKAIFTVGDGGGFDHFFPFYEIMANFFGNFYNFVVSL